MKKGDSVQYLAASQPNHAVTFPPATGTVDLSAMESLPAVRTVTINDPERSGLEQYIHERFVREYGANINKFMPYLIKFHSDRQIYATLGFRTAANSPLFLETYLGRPIEKELAEITGLNIRREKIVEVGNLAATRPGSSASLFGALACFLDQTGYEWAVICATPAVQNVFSKLQIPLLGLAEATADALPDDQKKLWGNYYSTRPQVMAVHVRTAYRCIKDSALGNRLLGMLYPSIEAMTEAWSLQHD